MTQHSLMAGCSYIIASTWAGQTLKPLTLIIRFNRSTRLAGGGCASRREEMAGDTAIGAGLF
jgi:hypothetical protein